jgi:hypothetical protein
MRADFRRCQRRSGVGSGLLVRLCVGLVPVGVLVGCAATVPSPRESSGGGPGVAGGWVCSALEGTTAEPWYSGTETWEERDGVMSSVHEAPWREVGGYGRPTEEEAFKDALAATASAALDLLERRGLSYGSDKRAEIETRAVEALLSGDEPSFPRVHIAGKVVERCRNRKTGEDSWRAKVLAEYPIGELRGDVVNATWERERILRDVEVRRASAATYFADGLWLDGRLELERALALLAETGVSLAGVPTGTRATPAWGSPDATQADRVWWHLREILATQADLLVEPTGSLEVLEIGARCHVEATFRVTYAWEGRATPAVGVPMRYEVEGGAAAILDGDPVTGENGIVRCRILRAFGKPGQYRLVAAVDDRLLRNAGVQTFGKVVTQLAGATGGSSVRSGAPEASQKLFLVEGGHGVTICAEFAGELDRDVSQARAGFVQRMAKDGCLTQDCGPGVDVVVSGKVSVVTVVEPGLWTSQVTIEGVAFDQRFAREIPGTAITVAETSTEGRRDGELRALREAGRLLAVYFSERIMASGE